MARPTRKLTTSLMEVGEIPTFRKLKIDDKFDRSTGGGFYPNQEPVAAYQ